MSSVGKRWTKNDEAQIVDLHRSGRNYAEICDFTGRTVNGISERFKKIAVQMKYEGVSDIEIYRATGVSSSTPATIIIQPPPPPVKKTMEEQVESMATSLELILLELKKLNKNMRNM